MRNFVVGTWCIWQTETWAEYGKAVHTNHQEAAVDRHCSQICGHIDVG